MAEPSDALAPREEENDPHYEPVIRLTEQVDVKTNEENEDVTFKLRAKLFRFDKQGNEWKERGTGDVRLLAHKETKKVRLVMRRDKTHKVCANHFIGPEMKLQPNIGSDRSWVWSVIADFSENPPTSETLAIRFANSDHANQFKTAFEDARTANSAIVGDEAPETKETKEPETEEATTEAKKEEEKVAEEKKEEVKKDEPEKKD